MTIRIIAYAALISLALAFLWHLSNIWQYGEHLIDEPNQTILMSETALILGIFIFGIYCLRKDYKNEN